MVQKELTWFDRAGRQTGAIGDVIASLTGFRISPDGGTVALSLRIKGNPDVWLMETARGVLRPFTSEPGIDADPVWAPNSDRIAFQSRRSGPNNVWLKHTNGGTEERLRESVENEVPADWSLDGRFILFSSGGSQNLWALPLEGDAKQVAVANTTFVESDGRFSPDGRSVAYRSNETGRNEIYVVPFPGPGAPTRVSTNGGGTPAWREDGREIGADNQLTAVSVTPQQNGRMEVGTPTALFPIPQGAPYDVTRDGQRILVGRPVGQATTPPITIILNWKPKP